MPFNLFGDLDTNGNVNQPPPYGYIGFGGGSNTAGLSQIEISDLSITTVEGALPASGTPEPGTGGLFLMGSALVCMGAARGRRQRDVSKA
jgi:hypothetical protein